MGNDTREALAAETAWRDGWRACRDSEFVGIESENDEWASRSAGLLDRLAALTEQPAAPQGVPGFVLVPKEPTAQMERAAFDELELLGTPTETGTSMRNRVYRAMLAAAPAAPAQERGVQAEPVAWRPKLACPIDWVTGAPREDDLRHWAGAGCEIEYAYAAAPAQEPQQPAAEAGASVARLEARPDQQSDSCAAPQAGFVLVPKEPTQAMLDAAFWNSDDRSKQTWAAMLAAAPQGVSAELNGGRTGSPPGMLQDDSRELSQWLASKPDARIHAREAAASIAAPAQEAVLSMKREEREALSRESRRVLQSAAERAVQSSRLGGPGAPLPASRTAQCSITSPHHPNAAPAQEPQQPAKSDVPRAPVAPPQDCPVAGQDSRTPTVAPGGQPLLQADSQDGFGDSVSAPVEPSGATLSPCAASQWISVSERLPEIGAEVLVFAPTKDRHRVTALARFIRYEGAADYYWDNVYPGRGNMHLSQSVTHWMPLPPPPQVDRGESSSEGGES